MYKEIGIKYQIVAHLLPVVACLYNFMITDFLFYRRYSRFCFGLAVLYVAGNYAVTKLTGIKTYRWDDLPTLVLLGYYCCGAMILP